MQPLGRRIDELEVQDYERVEAQNLRDALPLGENNQRPSILVPEEPKKVGGVEEKDQVLPPATR